MVINVQGFPLAKCCCIGFKHTIHHIDINQKKGPKGSEYLVEFCLDGLWGRVQTESHLTRLDKKITSISNVATYLGRYDQSTILNFNIYYVDAVDHQKTLIGYSKGFKVMDILGMEGYPVVLDFKVNGLDVYEPKTKNHLGTMTLKLWVYENKQVKQDFVDDRAMLQRLFRGAIGRKIFSSSLSHLHRVVPLDLANMWAEVFSREGLIDIVNIQLLLKEIHTKLGIEKRYAAIVIYKKIIDPITSPAGIQTQSSHNYSQGSPTSQGNGSQPNTPITDEPPQQHEGIKSMPNENVDAHSYVHDNQSPSNQTLEPNNNPDQSEPNSQATNPDQPEPNNQTTNPDQTETNN